MTIISDKDIAEIQAPLKAELESLRQENTRLREALEKIANTPVFSALGAQVNAFTAQKALNPPKNR